ncbi:hypothetical protein BBP40_011847 [Aspergillus hancockii]|nr:hypothetical protein BBP40_011847 [Aspergillus hancockii]
MSPPTDEVRAGFVVSVKKEGSHNGEPTVFTATQVPTVNSLPEVSAASVQAAQSFELPFGPIKLIGYVNPDNWEIGVRVEIFGAHILNIYGNLKDGVVGKIDLFLAKGEIRFYLKNGKEVWVHIKVEVTFDGKYEEDIKLISF